MKKIVGSLVLLSSLLVIASSCGTGKAKLVNSQELSIKGIEKISISYNSDRVNLYESQTDQLKIEEYLVSTKKNSHAAIQKDQDRLSIKGGKRQSNWFHLNDRSHIDIYLPKEYHESLDFQLTSGDLRASQNFELKEFTSSLNSGSLKLKGVNAPKIELHTTSGAIKVDQLTGDQATIKVNSGSVKLGQVIVNKLVGKATSGNLKIDYLKGQGQLTVNSGQIKLGQVIGGANLKATSGSIKGSFIKVSHDIQAVTNSGSIKLIVPKNLSFTFNSQINSGSVQTDFEEVLTEEGNLKQGVVGKQPEIKLETKATSGSIKVLREN